MKKIISILLVAVLVLSVATVPVFAQTQEWLYKDKFFEKYANNTSWYEDEEVIYFEEDYFDVDEDDAIDYVLIYAHLPAAHDTLHYADLGTHFIEQGCYYYPFGIGYALYDVELDDYTVINKNIANTYPFMADYLKENPIGTPFGDADRDGELSVLDATEIQLGLAGLASSTDWCCTLLYNITDIYRSDIDRDGSVTILDATGIQLKLAGIENLNEDMVYVEYDEVYYPNTYPEKPESAVSLEFEIQGNANSYTYTHSHLGYSDSFMAVIKSKEQYEYVFDGFNYYSFSEEFFDTHWLVASVIHTCCDEEVAKIDSVSVLGDTLYVYLNQYIPDTDNPLSESTPPYISLVAIEKEKLYDVTDIVRVNR